MRAEPNPTSFLVSGTEEGSCSTLVGCEAWRHSQTCANGSCACNAEAHHVAPVELCGACLACIPLTLSDIPRSPCQWQHARCSGARQCHLLDTAGISWNTRWTLPASAKTAERNPISEKCYRLCHRGIRAFYRVGW